MALSQLQCLDDNHVNHRTNESKPEFLYSEDQRLALEAFLRDGREAFFKYLGARGLRGFLSDLELDSLAETVEPYDPGTDIFPEDAGEDQAALSLHYWPELSDRSIPQMDLGWPDCASYRGVTRTSVYTQPPLDDQAHIKEVIRKMIAQAQKVIAVVMDVFTDVDIFRDLLDASFKRKVSVYILLESSTLPHFRSMCQRAQMHAGHFKNLRVRCTDGAEFYTRSCTKIRGRMGHRFMFIDGDKAVSGSYSFTWSSSRLDRNLISVITGQAVETFDKLFRVLYATSHSVDLRKDATEPEPEAEPIPAPAAVVPPSAEMVRKLYSAKYALVALGNPNTTPPPEPKNSDDSKNQGTKKRGGKGANKEATQDAPPTHPGLIDLEKACMMSYLPTWPEPDPASDVIGFINIRDNRKQNQVHLQRSEMYETSQAIRFSSPFSKAKEILPEVATPRDFTIKQKEVNELQPAQEKTKAKEAAVDVAPPTKPNKGPSEIKSKTEEPVKKLPAAVPQSKSNKNTTTNHNKHSNTSPKQDAGHNNTPQLKGLTSPQSRSETSPPDTKGSSHTTQTVTTLSESNTKTEVDSISNGQEEVGSRTRALEASCTQDSHLHSPTDVISNTEPHTQSKTHTDSQSQADHTQSQNSSEIAPIIQTPTTNSHKPSPQSVSSTPLSGNSPVSITTSKNPGYSSPLTTVSSSSIPALTSSSATLNPALPLSSASPSAASTPPIPKPRTVQLVIKGDVTDNGQKIQEVRVVPIAEKSTTPVMVLNEPAVATTVQTSPEKVAEIVQELQNGSQGETGAQKTAMDILNVVEAPQQKWSVISQEPKNEEDVGGDDRAGMQLIAGHKAESDSLKVPTHTDGTHAGTHSQQGNPSLTPEHPADSTPDTAKHNTTHNNIQPKPSQAPGGTHTPEKPLRLHLSEIHTPDLLSPTSERELRSLTALTRSPTPDGFLPRSPTPDFRTPTSDFRTYTTDFQTPTPDGYISPSTDSAPSTTSEEFYECCESPFQEPVLEQLAPLNHVMTEEHISLAHTNNANATSPVYINSNSLAGTLGSIDMNTFSSETESLSEHEEEKVRKLSEEAKRKANHLKDVKETGDINKEAQPQAPKKKKVLNESAAERQVKGGRTTDDLQLTKGFSEGKRPDTEKAGDNMERMNRPQATDGQKLLHASPNPPRGQQQDREASSSFPPPRPSRALSPNWAKGPRESRQQNEAESKVLPGNAIFPHRPPSRPPPPVNAGAVGTRQKQAVVSQSQQSFFSRQLSAAQDRTGAGQMQNQHAYPKPQTSFLLPQSHRGLQLHTQSQNQAGSLQEAHWQEEGKNPFSVTFSRLYSLKGLKEKMSRLPAQSKRGSGSAYGQRHNSTS